VKPKSTRSHLSYCTNIHAGEQWSELFPLLQEHVPKVKQQVCPDAEFGLGLRASMSSIKALQHPEALEHFRQWLSDEGVYVFTVNGFPYGAFHGTKVKADVYRPDWSEPHRLEYTCAIADVLAKLSPPDNFGSISTVPGTFRDWASDNKRQDIVDNLLRCVVYCIKLEQQTGVTIAIALEPEPACLLETVDDVLTFFQDNLYSPAAVQALATLSGTSTNDARNALHTHLGVCYDICHAAVEFEDPLVGIQRMQQAGIPIIKLQLSSALRLPNVDSRSLASLERFNEPVYLHQVVEKKKKQLTRFHDLPLAIKAHQKAHQLESQHNSSQSNVTSDTANNQSKEWRVHFHVPVFLDTLEHFGTTQQQLADVLKAHAHNPIAPHLEVETYTWDVLPEHYRQVDVSQAIARELNWVSDTLQDTGKV